MNWGLVTDILPGVMIVFGICWVFMVGVFFLMSEEHSWFDFGMSMATSTVWVVVVAAMSLTAVAVF